MPKIDIIIFGMNKETSIIWSWLKDKGFKLNKLEISIFFIKTKIIIIFFYFFGFFFWLLSFNFWMIDITTTCEIPFYFLTTFLWFSLFIFLLEILLCLWNQTLTLSYFQWSNIFKEILLNVLNILCFLEELLMVIQ